MCDGLMRNSYGFLVRSRPLTSTAVCIAGATPTQRSHHDGCATTKSSFAIPAATEVRSAGPVTSSNSPVSGTHPAVSTTSHKPSRMIHLLSCYGHLSATHLLPSLQALQPATLQLHVPPMRMLAA